MAIKKGYYVYILTNQYNNVFYIGFSNSLDRRTIEHKESFNKESFTARYNINKLVYFEEYNEVKQAIDREKQIKKWSRVKKIELITRMNPLFKDLSSLE